MSLSLSDRTELDRLGIDNVRLKIAYAGPGPGSVVPGLGPGFGMTRSDVEEWLAEQSRDASRLQLNILWWAKAAAWISLFGIVVAMVIAGLAYLPLGR
jgi:hypothetical protein